VVAAGWLSVSGNWMATALADIVLVFGSAQLAGLLISRGHTARTP